MSSNKNYNSLRANKRKYPIGQNSSKKQKKAKLFSLKSTSIQIGDRSSIRKTWDEIKQGISKSSTKRENPINQISEDEESDSSSSAESDTSEDSSCSTAKKTLSRSRILQGKIAKKEEFPLTKEMSLRPRGPLINSLRGSFNNKGNLRASGHAKTKKNRQPRGKYNAHNNRAVQSKRVPREAKRDAIIGRSRSGKKRANSEKKTAVNTKSLKVKLVNF